MITLALGCILGLAIAAFVHDIQLALLKGRIAALEARTSRDIWFDNGHGMKFTVPGKVVSK